MCKCESQFTAPEYLSDESPKVPELCESRRDAPLRGESQFTAPEPRSGESPKVPELRESPLAPESLRDESPCTVPESLRDESRRDAPRSDES